MGALYLLLCYGFSLLDETVSIHRLKANDFERFATGLLDRGSFAIASKREARHVRHLWMD